MKIAFIGGGSVQWTAKLVADMALTPALDGTELVLHDIDADALALWRGVFHPAWAVSPTSRPSISTTTP